MASMRLQKYLAEAGVASRRKAEELIRQGRVKVNGVVVAEMGRVVSSTDVIEVDGKKIDIQEKKVYIMLNKPVGYITTVKDQFSRPTVINLIREVKERIYPVGRLDYDTSGLLLLTNDGNFAYRLTHPKHSVKKVYHAEVLGIPGAQEAERFRRGIEIDGYRTAPAGFVVKEKRSGSSIVEITIHEGKNRQIRKMCEIIGHPVISLKRVAIGNLQLGSLPEGKWRYLSFEEVESLMRISQIAGNS